MLRKLVGGAPTAIRFMRAVTPHRCACAASELLKLSCFDSSNHLQAPILSATFRSKSAISLMLPYSRTVRHRLKIHCVVAMSWCAAMIICMERAHAATFPYGAQVIDKSATIRSGPGEKYYHTDRLPRGSRVEVYRHDGDWAAIRPPAGSYSWVPASAIELEEDTSIGQVVDEGARTRIGSRFSDDHNAHYVALRRDELVEVIGRRTLLDEGKPSLWYQIKPPAGEFRWVRLAALEPLPNPLALQHESPSGKSRLQSAQFVETAPQLLSADADDLDSFDEGDKDVAAADTGDNNTKSDENGTWTLDAPDAEPKPLSIANSPQLKTAAPNPSGVDDTSDAPSVLAETPFKANLNDNAAFRPAAKTTNPTLLRQELAKINAELSRQIAGDPTTWELNDVLARTRAVIDLSSTELRGQAQTLLSRITQFKDIQRRHQDIVRGATENLFAGGTLAEFDYGDFATTPTVAPPVNARQSQTPGAAYDGMGWLMPIVTRHAGLPRYALTDDNGNILQFVSPRPGLNLRNYERRRIGIIGRKGFVPRFNKSHLTAERIISLDRVRY